MIHCFKFDDKNIVLDVFSGSIHMVDEVAYDIIEMYENNSHEQIIETIKAKHGVTEEDIRECFEDIELLIKADKFKSSELGRRILFLNLLIFSYIIK